MSTRTTKKQEASQAEPGDFPAIYDFDSDGPIVEGPFVAAGLGYTANGEKPFVTLQVGDELRTVWLFYEVLRLAFAREVARREDREIHVGESIRIERLSERDSANGRKYFNYRVAFGDSPPIQQSNVFGTVDVADQATEAAVNVEAKSDAWGDDIPFD